MTILMSVPNPDTEEQQQVEAMLSEGGASVPGQEDVPLESDRFLAREAKEPLLDALLHRPRQQLHRLSQRVGRQMLARFNERRATAETAAAEVPSRIHRVAEQTQLWTEMLDDYTHGRYHDVSWGSIAAIAGVLLYAVSPADVIPDVLPFVGAVDDVALTVLVATYVRKEMVRYCRFKGYDVAKYFNLDELEHAA